MAKQTVALGTVANDGTGDTLRAGGDKINDNFDELYGMIDTDGTLAANSDSKIATQKAVKTYVASQVVGLFDPKGSTDCSANPNYPAALKGDLYLVSVAGKIGGASGKVVTAGDVYVAFADNAGGTEASVGTSWQVIEGNIAYTPVNKAGDTMTGALHVPDDAYDATSWNASTEVPTKNAVRDKIEALAGGGFTAASTTEVLTGTDSAKGVTPDALAALWEQGADVASAGTTSLGEGGYFNITGTTTITDIDFATDKAGRRARLKFAGILTLTHNASTLILPTGANITTAAGDTAEFVSEGSDVVRCVAYQRADGTALAASSSGTWALAGTGQTATGVWDQAVDGSKANVDFVGLAGKTDIMVVVEAVTKANSGLTQLQVSVDNGSTFFTSSGNYTQMAAAGSETNTTAVFFHGTNATLGRSGVVRIVGANLAGPRLIEQLNNGDAHRLFKTSASSSAINAVRISGSAAGNLTGGKIYCYAR